MAGNPSIWKCAPPAQMPDEYKEQVAKLDKPLTAVLVQNLVPWKLQATLGEWNVCSTERLAHLFSDGDNCRATASTLLGYHAEDAPTVALASMAISMAYNACKERHQRPTADSPRKERPTEHIGGWHREDLLKIWEVKTGRTRPEQRHQGSNELIAKMKKSLEEGALPDILPHKITSADPFRRITLKKKRKKDTDSEEEPDATLPYDLRTWEDYVTIHNNTLMMCIWNYSHHEHLQCDIQDVDRYYRQWHRLVEKGRYSMTTIIIAERKAFQLIREHCFSGCTFKESLQRVMDDHVFWQEEVFSRPKPNKQTENKNRQDDQKGKGKGSGDKGRKKTKLDERRQKNKELCRGYNQNKCTYGDKCKYEHKCSGRTPTGKPCKGNHPAVECPHNSS